MADRFYINCPLDLGSVSLDGAEAHHLAVVCRLRAGDQVCLFNGDGREYRAVIASADKRRVALQVEAVVAPRRELPFALEVAAPLPKGDRAQFLLEKLTELGVTTFVPLTTRRSVAREARLERLARYVIEASKQCGRNVLLRVQPYSDWENYCRRGDLPALRLMAHVGEAAGAAPAGQAMAMAVGPEGGFTAEEVEAARQAGWRVVGLGPRVLRVETAALVLAAWAGMGAMGGKGNDPNP
jgi:16S rRNA (uracil1498-N3)-methyltransferase